MTTYFNPQNDPRLMTNYRRFAAGIQTAGLPLWTIELAYDDDPFQLAPAQRLIQIRGTRAANLLWQKERLLNLLLAYVPGDAEGILWIDADVEFLNPRWVEQTRAALSRYEVVQLFADAHQIDPAGKISLIRPSSGHRFVHHGPTPDFTGNHPGFAWAARARLLRDNGFEDRTVCSIGDTIMARAFGSGLQLDPAINGNWLRAIERWSLPVSAAVQGKFGYVPGSILHLWHGDIKKRGYLPRFRALADHRFDPDTDLVKDANGLWAWSEAARAAKPAMIAAVAACYSRPTPD